VPWAWGVNSFCTVIGTAAALMLGMAFGFKVVLAALCYVVALAALWRDRDFASSPTAADLAAAVLAGLGVFWLVGRLYVA